MLSEKHQKKLDVKYDGLPWTHGEIDSAHDFINELKYRLKDELDKAENEYFDSLSTGENQENKERHYMFLRELAGSLVLGLMKTESHWKMNREHRNAVDKGEKFNG
ncbi:hypothetical protein R4036_004589 [Salmonella enterica]|nr:hypothetical protein [Salmonella enterica]